MYNLLIRIIHIKKDTHKPFKKIVTLAGNTGRGLLNKILYGSYFRVILVLLPVIFQKIWLYVIEINAQVLLFVKS